MDRPELDAAPPALRGTPSRAGARVRRGMLVARLAMADAGPYVRRLLDVMVAVGALLVLGPLLALAALAVRVTSPGPALFFQERIGKNGRRFRMIKLRTMRVGADAEKARLAASVGAATSGVRFKIQRDPRITPVGRVLRKYSIDELPQLWNVARGDMTLIGPRPAVWVEVSRYDARALRRLEVQQGLTCLWQVGGRSDLSFEQQVDLDIEYVDRTPPSEELRIVARTIPAVLTGRGAY
jgi:lipopolysaccharide/colanic/teichoic acid biosynthesis glycosyltransferase